MRMLRIITGLLTMVAVLISCERRDLYVPHQTPVKVVVQTDWAALGSNPDGASICFYPENGGKPHTFQTNSVARAVCYVPSGFYTVIVYNRTPQEYGSMTFEDMDELGKAHVSLYKRSYPWINTEGDAKGITTYEPEEIVIGRTDHFEVHDVATSFEQWDGATKAGEAGYEPAVADSVSVVTKPVVYTGTVRVRVEGIQNIKSVRGYLDGMARSAYIATRSATDQLAMHALESWKIQRDEGDYTKGYITTTFKCFGLPEQHLESKDIENNHLNLEFLLVDGTTVKNYDFAVGDRIEQIRDALVVSVEIGIDSDHVILPDVKPEGGSSSGFDVSIDEWPDDEVVVVPV